MGTAMEAFEEIIGERLRLSDIHNRMNEEYFSDLRVCVDDFKRTIHDEESRLAALAHYSRVDDGR